MRGFIFLIMALFVLAGCTNEEAASESPAETKASDASFPIPEKTKYLNNPQAAEDESLMNPGDTTEDEDGQLTLQKIKQMERFKEVGPMHMAVKDVKILSYSPSPDLVDFFHGYSDDETNFHYVKLTIAVKHTGKAPVHFAPVELLETNMGEKKDFQDDFYLENLVGEYKPGDVRRGEMGFVLNDTALSELNSLTISSSDVLDENQEVVEEGQTWSIEF